MLRKLPIAVQINVVEKHIDPVHFETAFVDSVL